MQFWHELASEMSREWFAANKQRYQSVWVEPMLALLRDDLRNPVLVWKRELHGAKSRLRSFAEALEERDFIEQERQVGGEARHRRSVGHGVS